jgi:hypothetical protein
MPRVLWTSGARSTVLLSLSRRLSPRRFSSDGLRSCKVRRRSRSAERRKNWRTSMGFPCSLRPFKRLITGGAAVLGVICTKPWYSVECVAGLTICRISHLLIITWGPDRKNIQEGRKLLLTNPSNSLRVAAPLGICRRKIHIIFVVVLQRLPISTHDYSHDLWQIPFLLRHPQWPLIIKMRHKLFQ